MDKYYPKQETEFWCSCCDYRKVNSKDESTGSFYMQFGHVWPGTGDEEYTSVIFAYCKECEPRNVHKALLEE